MLLSASVNCSGLVAPMIGECTYGLLSIQASAMPARGTPRSSAILATASTIDLSPGSFGDGARSLSSDRAVPRTPQSRTSRPPASGLHGMTPTPVAAQYGI